jgi:hypothetical protein
MENIRAIYSELNLLFKDFDPDYVVQNGEFSVTRLRFVCDRFNKFQFTNALENFDMTQMNHLVRHYAEVNSILSNNLMKAADFFEERRMNLIKSIDPSGMIDSLGKDYLHLLYPDFKALSYRNKEIYERVANFKRIGMINGNADKEVTAGARQIIVEITVNDIRFWLENVSYSEVAPFYDHYIQDDCSVVFTYHGFLNLLTEKVLSSIKSL